LTTSVQVYNGQDTGITNFTMSVPAFTNSGLAVTVSMPGTVPPPPTAPFLTGSVTGKLFAISFNTTPGQTYVVQSCSAPNTGIWSTVTNFAAIGTNMTIYDAVAAVPEKLYRVTLTDAVMLNGSMQGTQFVLVFNAKTGRSYTVQYSDVSGTWNTLTNLTGQGTNVAITNPISSPRRLFRVSTP
jgi:hypothetical protein